MRSWVEEGHFGQNALFRDIASFDSLECHLSDTAGNILIFSKSAGLFIFLAQQKCPFSNHRMLNVYEARFCAVRCHLYIKNLMDVQLIIHYKYSQRHFVTKNIETLNQTVII
jgi:hypothetical protein